MILLALLQLFDFDGYQKRALHVLLQGQVGSLERFRDQHVYWLRHDIGDDGVDPTILEQYDVLLDHGDDNCLTARLLAVLDAINRKKYIPDDVRDHALRLVRDLRAALAAASVETLEPDLVILDEFQRFRHLLSPDNAAGELAHHLFQYEAAKVLLLSATPYKPFTLAAEGDEDHARDLFRTLDFLAHGRHDAEVDVIRQGLRDYRAALEKGDSPAVIVTSLRHELLKLMSRNERPVAAAMTTERLTPADRLKAEDLADYATLTRVADAVGHPRDRGLITPEYWKSAPYFLTFSDGYQLGRRLKASARGAELTQLLATSHHIRPEAVEGFTALDPGNARMRVLVEDTIDQGWWQLLWLPPSLNYFEPRGPYAADGARDMTKRVVFSSWAATPASVASILSYEAERRAAEGSSTYTAYTPEVRRKVTRHLQYVSGPDGRPRNMAVLLCHWPLAGLARAVDPLQWIAEADGEQLTRDAALDRATRVMEQQLVETAVSLAIADGSADAQERPWQLAFRLPGSWPDADSPDILSALSGGRGETEEEAGESTSGLAAHIEEARAGANASFTADSASIAMLAEVALFSPANVAFRSLSRLQRGSAAVTDWGVFQAAAILANGLRSLFNRPDVTQLIDRVGGDGIPYWRKMLKYISMGNLEAVLDEYLHQLLADITTGEATDALLAEISRKAAEALSLRSPTLRALVPEAPDSGLAFSARFALRYGGRTHDAEDARQPEVRRAFNSPFWPFVLASTSVGQEGIDFHWWCHAVFHWNTPSNPVDFEQREGRVDRYRGHAVRKNIASAHGRTALANCDGHPWDMLFELATDHQDQLGDFSPGWVYPGPHRIERHVAPITFSTDLDRYERMKRDVALYRLTFGQPRQEDMLDLMRRRGVDTDAAIYKASRIDLAP